MYRPLTSKNRKILRITAMTVLLLSTGSAIGEKLNNDSNNLARAAYCFGVLQEMYRVHSENLYMLQSTFAKNFCDYWQQEGFSSTHSCARLKSQEALVGTRIKMERYSEYIRLSTTNIGDVETLQLSTLSAKGRNDQMTSWTRRDSRDFACGTTCRLDGSRNPSAGSPKCVADCIERYDPTQANIYRCVMPSSALPF
jgi:hypothetical protein